MSMLLLAGDDEDITCWWWLVHYLYWVLKTDVKSFCLQSSHYPEPAHFVIIIIANITSNIIHYWAVRLWRDQELKVAQWFWEFSPSYSKMMAFCYHCDSPFHVSHNSRPAPSTPMNKLETEYQLRQQFLANCSLETDCLYDFFSCCKN